MTDLLSLIKSRHSSRVVFDPERPVPEEDLRKILEAGSWAPTAHNMQNFEIIIVDDKKLIDQLATVKAPISLTFVQENYKQLSFSEAELLQKKTGVLGAMFPAAWRNPNATKEELLASDGNDFLHQELASSPILGIVLYDPKRRAPASKGDFLGIISLGCVTENMWLMATELGLDFHIVSSLSSGPMAKALRKLLHIPSHLIIAYSFRLGYAISPRPYLRVRRDVEDFVYHNMYGVLGV